MHEFADFGFFYTRFNSITGSIKRNSTDREDATVVGFNSITGSIKSFAELVVRFRFKFVSIPLLVRLKVIENNLQRVYGSVSIPLLVRLKVFLSGSMLFCF